MNILKWLSLRFLIVAHQEDHDLTLDMNEIKVKFSRLHLTGLPKFNCWWCKLDLVDTLVLLSTSLQNYLPHCGLSNAWYAGEQRSANYDQIPSLYSLWAKNGFYTFIWLKKIKKLLYDLKIIWNLNLCVHIWHFIGKQLFMTQLSSFNRDHVLCKG